MFDGKHSAKEGVFVATSCRRDKTKHYKIVCQYKSLKHRFKEVAFVRYPGFHISHEWTGIPDDERDPLYVACEYGHLELVQYLVGRGYGTATIRAYSTKIAIERENRDIFLWLLQTTGWVHNLPSFHPHGTVLNLVICGGDLQAVTAILQQRLLEETPRETYQQQTNAILRAWFAKQPHIFDYLLEICNDFPEVYGCVVSNYYAEQKELLKKNPSDYPDGLSTPQLHLQYKLIFNRIIEKSNLRAERLRILVADTFNPEKYTSSQPLMVIPPPLLLPPLQKFICGFVSELPTQFDEISF